MANGMVFAAIPNTRWQSPLEMLGASVLQYSTVFLSLTFTHLDNCRPHERYMPQELYSFDMTSGVYVQWHDEAMTRSGHYGQTPSPFLSPTSAAADSGSSWY